MYSINEARRGGKQRIASFGHLYNLLALEDPQALALLAGDWKWSLPAGPWATTADANGKVSLFRPIMSSSNGNISLTFSRGFLGKPRSGPPEAHLSAEQVHVLDTLQRLCEEHSFVLEPRRGDILVFNNLAFLHARDEFVDDGDEPIELVSEGQDNPIEPRHRHIVGFLFRDREYAWPHPPGTSKQIEREYQVGREEAGANFRDMLHEWEEHVISDIAS